MRRPLVDGPRRPSWLTSPSSVNFISLKRSSPATIAPRPMSRRIAAAAIPGPRPPSFCLGSLGACTSITLRMYAGRKDWELGKITVGLRYTPAADGRKAHIERRLSFAKPLTDEQSLRLLEIAGKTPVTLALTSGITIDTSIAQHVPAA